MLRADADRKTIDDRKRRRIDHVNAVGAPVRHINSRQCPADRRAQTVGGSAAVEIARIEDRRHSRHGFDRLARIEREPCARAPTRAAPRALRQTPPSTARSARSSIRARGQSRAAGPTAQRDHRAEPQGHAEPTKNGATHENLPMVNSSAVAGRLPDRVHRPRHDQIDAELPEFGARAARIAVDAVAGAAGLQASVRTRRGSTASVSEVSARPA